MNSRKPIYFDCAATTPPDPRVVEIMLHHLSVEFGNQGSRTHEYGTQARKAVERARDQIAAVLGARRSEVIFTSGATEANNLAILGAASAAPGSHIVTTHIEHPSSMEPVTELESRGFSVTRVASTRGGFVQASDVLAAIRPDTSLVSVMHVNNETGVVQPIREIADGIPASGPRFHVDAAQGFGKLIEDLRHPGISLITASAHKIGGPQGIGTLIARRREGPRMVPMMFGGGQEGGMRPGTLPGHLIAGFGLAAELAVREAEPRAIAALAFRAKLISQLKSWNAEWNGDLTRASPYVLNVSFPGLDNEQVIDAWSDLVAVSNGAACASQRAHCSHVLNAMGIDDQRAAGAIRFSWYQSPETPDFQAMAHALHSIPVATNGRRA